MDIILFIRFCTFTLRNISTVLFHISSSNNRVGNLLYLRYLLNVLYSYLDSTNGIFFSGTKLFVSLS